MGEHIETYLEIQKPISRTVFVINYDGIQSSFFLNFPYIVFYGIKGSRYLFVGCCDEKPNLNSIIYFLPLSNISTSGRVCLSDAVGQDLKDQINYFWSSVFDTSRSWICNDILESLFGDLMGCFDKWQTDKPTSLVWTKRKQAGSTYSHGTLLEFMDRCDDFITERQYWELTRPEMTFLNE